MTLGQWLDYAQKKLKVAGIDSAGLDASLLAEAVLEKNRTWLSAHGELELNRHQLSNLSKYLGLRVGRRPMAYITGHREFYSLEFIVNPDVLIPRPETENMVEEAIKIAAKKAKALEVGTGSGCVAIALKINRPDLHVTATDVSARALKLARKNALKHQAGITFLLSDLMRDVQNRFDLILANLPYVPEGSRRMAELDSEPQVALYSGADGLDLYRQFLPNLSAHLTDTGRAIIEAGPTQREELKLLAGNLGFSLQTITEYIFVLTPNT
jgi:release factor glutamine methyltransferase